MSEQTQPAGNDLLAALKRKDRQAFATLVEWYSAKIYQLALKMSGSPQDAEDVLQETFLKAMRSVEKFEGRSSLLTWLYRIAVNESLMLIRKRKPELDLTSHPDAETIEVPDPVGDCCLPEKELLTREAREFLDHAIQRLPEMLRVVFVLRDIEGISIRETAEALQLSAENVKIRLLRARLRLRNELTAYFSERVREG